jgi:hypothetical protein
VYQFAFDQLQISAGSLKRLETRFTVVNRENIKRSNPRYRAISWNLDQLQKRVQLDAIAFALGPHVVLDFVSFAPHNNQAIAQS